MKQIAKLLLVALMSTATIAMAAEKDLRDLSWFLQRLRAVDHLPELEDSSTYGSGTWNPTDGNMDITWFRGAKDNFTNVLFEADGPGCVHRIFCDPPGNPESRLQVFVDHQEKPVLDEPYKQLVTPGKSPLPYPLIFHDTWHGILFPMPFAKHIRVQVYDPSGEPKEVKQIVDGVKDFGLSCRGWGRFYEWDYTIYEKGTPVKSLSWPLSEKEQKEVDATAEAWKRIVEKGLAEPAGDHLKKIEKVLEIPQKSSLAIALDGPGTVRRLRVYSDQPEAMLRTRLRATWDDAESPSVDAPVGYFFGCGDHGYDQFYHSLLIGTGSDGSYADFPMPFRKKATLDFINQTDEPVTLYVTLLVDQTTPVPDNHGYFHATWTETKLNKDIRNKPYPDIVMAGKPGSKHKEPAYIYLKRSGCRGKYVGLLKHAGWPYKNWWGEGDALIWTDQSDWPPKYHGTGEECYFNSGHCAFSDKAISGLAHKVDKIRKTSEKCWFVGRPGDIILYNFHVNDAFQFQDNIQVAIEVDFGSKAYSKDRNDLVPYGGTAFWYAAKPLPADSDESVIWPRRVGPYWEALKNGTYEEFWQKNHSK